LKSPSLLGALAADRAVRQHVLMPPHQGIVHGNGERDLGPQFPRPQDQGNTIPFPYLLMIRRLIEQGEIRSAQSLLTFALSQGASSSDLARLGRILVPAVTIDKRIPGVGRVHEYAWLTTHGHSYRGEWVAVSGDSLLGHACSLTSLLADLQTSPASAPPLIHWIDPD
jgi:hypothetical protein